MVSFSEVMRYASRVDNATHALVGLLVAEVAMGAARRPSSSAARSSATFSATERGQARWMSVVANSLPDLDVAYANHFGAELGYLLHHRGHTHTLVAGPALGLALFGLWMLVCAWRRRWPSRSQQALLLGLALAGPAVHLGLDALNNYGVHPFWPLASHWVWGDSLFIIEPWLWVVLVPALAFELDHRLAKAAAWSVLGIGAVLSWSLDMVPWPVALALTFGGVGSAAYCARASRYARLRLALGGLIGVVSIFAAGSRFSDTITRRIVPAQMMLRDVVVTPSPGNPLCYGIITVSDDEDEYIARAGSLSLAPALMSPSECRIQPTGLTIGLRAPRIPNHPALAWEGEWIGSKSQLRQLAAEHCQVHAWLRFARVPFWRRQEAALWFLGDLRFDRDEGKDFDEWVVREPPEDCPKWVPDWEWPRSDILGPTPPYPSNAGAAGG